MSYSRIEKMVREVSALDSLQAASGLRRRDLDIILAPDATPKVAMMACAAVNLALRCLTGEIRVYFPAVAPTGLPWSKKSLKDQLCAASSAFGEPQRLRIVSSHEYGEMRLGLGCAVDGGVFADASGWMAGINTLLKAGRFTAAPAAAFAVSAAFAKLFKAKLLQDPSHTLESWTFSLADLNVNDSETSEWPQDLDLGSIGVLGAGAIGSAFVYVLWLSGWRAKIDIIDCQTYDEPNHETTFFIGAPEARRRRPKAMALAELAQRPGLQLNPVHHEVKVGSGTLTASRDAFVCAVDNAETRRVLDEVNAGVLLNSGVGGTREDAGHVVMSRHLPGDPPLSSRYKSNPSTISLSSTLVPPKEVNDDCSRLAYEDASLAAPFMGLSAGALLAAACAHRAHDRWPDVNYLKFDLLRLQASFCRDRFGQKGAGV